MLECGLCGARLGELGEPSLRYHRCPEEVESLRELLREVADRAGLPDDLRKRVETAGRCAEAQPRTPSV